MFQPFGYRYSVQSHLPPAEAKAAIRAGLKRWFDIKRGARGWIVGPFVCLWLSAMDSKGPMLIGRISADNFGSRISGRAGSDINGLLYFCLLIALLVFTLSRDGAGVAHNPMKAAIAVAVVVLGLSAVMWKTHRYRGAAEPLVHFLEKRLAAPGSRNKQRRAAIVPVGELSLNIDGSDHPGPVTDEAIAEALEVVEGGGFAILSRAAEHYLQTGADDAGYALERREGGSDRHFRALSRQARQGQANQPSIDQIHEAFRAYAEGREMPDDLTWEAMRS